MEIEIELEVEVETEIGMEKMTWKPLELNWAKHFGIFIDKPYFACLVSLKYENFHGPAFDW